MSDNKIQKTTKRRETTTIRSRSGKPKRQTVQKIQKISIRSQTNNQTNREEKNTKIDRKKRRTNKRKTKTQTEWEIKLDANENINKNTQEKEKTDDQESSITIEIENRSENEKENENENENENEKEKEKEKEKESKSESESNKEKEKESDKEILENSSSEKENSMSIEEVNLGNNNEELFVSQSEEEKSEDNPKKNQDEKEIEIELIIPNANENDNANESEKESGIFDNDLYNNNQFRCLNFYKGIPENEITNQIPPYFEKKTTPLNEIDLSRYFLESQFEEFVKNEIPRDDEAQLNIQQQDHLEKLFELMNENLESFSDVIENNWRLKSTNHSIKRESDLIRSQIMRLRSKELTITKKIKQIKSELNIHKLKRKNTEDIENYFEKIEILIQKSSKNNQKSKKKKKRDNN
ncbi:hypothetical protein M0812_06522 [Anaeramoeba flamelloides]|uniref:Uncharacterized protein n=1 Tax=Anaeramoeba flamelloides TaxID=1746091 RepID=A0AAV8ACZ0_9EUKA|nr:hypothetical protein M0812_06522 [Anaeramoeba flamelloides]